MMQRIPSFLPLFLILSTISTFVLGTCYAPNGSAFNDVSIQPCIAIQGVDSMCCALNVTANTIETCDPNGLCIAGKGEHFHYREFCTDSTWKSPNCLPKTICDDAVSPFILLSMGRILDMASRLFWSIALEYDLGNMME